MVNVLVVGGGGREHTIAWKLSQSTRVQHVYVVPGNGGTSSIGPEQPLVDGIVDTLKKHGIPCFGPSSKAAVIESSKAFSKDFMQRHNIPTARYKIFTNYDEAVSHLNSIDYSVVLKASGLAAGKGVLIPESKEEALEALKTLMVTKPFGTASDQVVIEERLQGPEVSVLAFTDGYTVSVMPPAQDHKRIGENDTGENTGGMGAYAPTPLCTDSLLEDIKKKVLIPTINGMRKESRPYIGVIYAGILLDVKTGINVLEFNCRFGDPETQVLLPLLESDLLTVFEACVEGRLDSVDINWKLHHSAATVVAASKGYPGSYQSGFAITGLEKVVGPVVFHAGTKTDNGKTLTSGGRVLAVTSVGTTLEKALEQSYKALQDIRFDGIYYRKDIGHKALKAASNTTSVTYKDSGVDIDNADNLIDDISPMAKATARIGTDASLGGFGGLFDLKAAGFKDPILVSGTDGVGTKLLIAQTVGKHDTIGIDLVAMSVNDILVQGAEPLFFLDYYATGKLQREVARDVIKGIAFGCKESNCALVGGETAEMPGMYPGGKYDLAGFAVGAVERDQVLPRPVVAGDVLIGLPSSGIHSNGYSLVRHLIEKNSLSYQDAAPFDSTQKLGEALLTPTKLYVKACMPLIKAGLVKAMAHITGGGITENLPRVLGDDVSAEVDLSSYELPPVFQWMSKAGNIHQEELIRTFNCGIGMVLVVDADKAQEVLSKLVLHGENPVKLGKLVRREKYPVHYKGTWKSK